MTAQRSPILEALYHGRGADAERLAAEAGLDALTIHEAAAIGATARIQALATQDPALVNAWADDGFQPLPLAAFFGQRQAAELLLALGGDVRSASRNAQGVTALHAALSSPEPDFARALIDAGADVNARQASGVTPLHEAAFTGDVDIGRLLLARGADPRATDREGRTPADVARARGQQAFLELLGERS